MKKTNSISDFRVISSSAKKSLNTSGSTYRELSKAKNDGVRDKQRTVRKKVPNITVSISGAKRTSMSRDNSVNS